MKTTDTSLAMLYANIKALRIHKGEKIASMAMKLGLSNQSIYHKFEMGERTKLDLFFFIRVCHILEVCPQYMLYISGVNLCELNGCTQTWDAFVAQLPPGMILPPPAIHFNQS